jgi:hypothetical protein
MSRLTRPDRPGSALVPTLVVVGLILVVIALALPAV